MNVAKRTVAALSVCALTAAISFGEVRSGRVTFYKDISVNGTIVKKGEYKVSFDDQSNELTITKDNKPVAKATGRLEKADKKSATTKIYSIEKDNATILTGITLAGERETFLIGDTAAGAKSGRE